MNAFTRAVDRMSEFLGILSMMLLAAAVLVVCEMILIRYVFRASTVWQTEFVIYALVAATFLGSSYVLLHRGHVGVDLLPTMLHGKARLALELTGGLISLAFCAVLAYSGWIYFHEAWAKNWTTDTVWALPLWIPLLPLPVGMAALCLQYVAELMKLTKGARLSASELTVIREGE
ncbi:MAG: TRAP transporter small permease [Hyphomicrobiaceae bacterium]|nr:TRAP transporter small permease [Hyphomicrobiaceae bacterium]MCC0007330.1 TRAP transporter small permease [Hyphomicrobiaceae bacterium]